MDLIKQCMSDSFVPQSQVSNLLNISKVLMAGLHDRGSFLSKLREPNDVRRLLMKKIWTYVTADWQVPS